MYFTGINLKRHVSYQAYFFPGVYRVDVHLVTVMHLVGIAPLTGHAVVPLVAGGLLSSLRHPMLCRIYPNQDNLNFRCSYGR